MAKMTFTKWLKQAKANTKIIERLEQIKKANTKIIERLEQIKYDYEQGQGLSYDDIEFLLVHQDFYKKRILR